MKYLSKLKTALVLIALCVLTQGCSSLLYYPSGLLFHDPKKFNLQPEDIWFHSSDGVKLNGWLFKNPKQKAKAVFVFFHGNGENMSSHYLSLVWILDHGYDFFIFDYRGYGRSEGDPNPEGTIKDGLASLTLIKEKYPNTPMIIFGQSLGGAISMRTYIDNKNDFPQVKLLIADSTFPSYKAAARSVLRQHWFTWILQPMTYVVLSDKYAPEDKIKDISPTPLVVMHGDQDQVVDYALGHKVFELAQEPKEFWTVEGGKHTDAFWNHGDIFKPKLLNKLKSLGM